MDTFAFIFGNTLGKMMAFTSDIDRFASSPGLGTFAQVFYNLAFPNYGFFGGSGLGKDMTPNATPFNQEDAVCRQHDFEYRDIDWISGSFDPTYTGLPKGVFGWGYAILGAGPFWIHHKLGLDNP